MDLTDAVVAASMIKSATIVPIHYNTRTKIKADDIEFARQIMLGQYPVPKVLRQVNISCCRRSMIAIGNQ